MSFTLQYFLIELPRLRSIPRVEIVDRRVDFVYNCVGKGNDRIGRFVVKIL